VAATMATAATARTTERFIPPAMVHPRK